MKKTLTLLLLLAGVTMEARAEDLIWNGSADHMTWNTTDKNWLQGKNEVEYADSDAVKFGDTGSGMVALGGVLAPASVTVNNSAEHDYTFIGDGSLTGNMTLTKSGSGTLTINTANDYKGATIINGGTLVLGSADALKGSGHIQMYNDAKLDLGTYALSTLTILFGENGTCSIGNGTLNGCYIEVRASNKLSLFGESGGHGTIALNEGSTLDLGNNSISNVIMDGSASIGNGALRSRLEVGEDLTLTLCGNLSGDGYISLLNGAKLDLGECVLDKEVNLDGSSASIGNGTQNGKISVLSGKTLTLCGDLSGKGSIYLGDNTTLDFGGYTLSKDVSLGGHSTIGNGALDTDLSVGAGKTLTLCGNLAGMGSILLGADSKLDLNGKILSKPVTLTENASIGNGTNNGSVTVSDKKALTLFGNLSGTGSIALGDKTTLDLNGKTLSNSVILNGKASISQGTLNGNLAVGEDMVLTLLGNLDGSGTISIGHKGVLALQGHTLSNNISVEGLAIIDNGTITGDLTVAEGQQLFLMNICSVQGTISLGDNAMLNLGDNTLSHSQTVQLDGSASIGNGRVDTNLSVGTGKTLSLCGNLAGAGTISLSSNATLDLNNNTLANYVTVTDTASIGNGTIDGSVNVYAGGSVRFTGETRIDKGSITAVATTVTALKEDSPGLLQELSVTNGLIAGTDRQTSLADGLRIESSASLMIKSMTITANNEIHVGPNVITLNQVTIDLSQAEYKLVGSDYYFQLQDLINCKLEMDDVVFDASEWELPTGFDPLVNGIGMDFGDDVNIDLETAKNLTLFMENYTSQTVSLDAQGRPVFKALVPIPEPATGTLSLLALCALTARRRRKH